MAWYIQHYFDPDFDHLRCKPASITKDDTDLYNLGYVQNVIGGQVLAELVPLESVTSPDPRFIRQTLTLPVGPNTHVDVDHATYLLASSNGYVFYNEGNITVKKMLNVRGDVSFHTGNIFFVGDMSVHGSVRAGFEVQANNVLIQGMVEGGSVRARRDLAITGGARGGAGEHCVLDAGGTLRSTFVEKVDTRAHDNILIEKYCLYANVYGGKHLVVQGRVYGGTVHAYGSIYIKEQLGNAAAIPTRVFLGYDPSRMRLLEKVDAQIATLSESIMHLTAVAGHLPRDANPTTRKLAAFLENREALLTRRAHLWEALHLNEQSVAHCRLVVTGKVFPGVEIGIGRAFYAVKEPLQHVCFQLKDDEIIFTDAASSKL